MPSDVQAGKLNRRFQVLRADDKTGTLNFSTITTVWGSISGLTGIESPAIQMAADSRIILRYRSDLTPRDRLQLDTRVFTIHSVVDPDGSQRQLTVLAKEMV